MKDGVSFLRSQGHAAAYRQALFFILSVKGLHGHWIECGGEYLNRENRFAGPNHIIKNIKIIILYLIKE